MKTKHKSGFSLVEIMVAVLILAVLAIGGAAVMYQTGGNIQRQQNKREALIVANHIVESYWNLNYGDLRDNYAGGTGSENSVVVNGRTMNLTVDFGAESFDGDGNRYIEISVDVDHLGSGDDVILITRRYLYGIGRAAL